MLVATIILALTYIGVAFGRLPKVNVDRASAAFTGAVLMVLLGVLTFDQAIGAIDFRTIALLLGMMVLISELRDAGFLTLLAVKSLALAKTPRRLLFMVVGATALFSAFLVNDAVVLLFTPVVIRTCRLMKTNPIPYLIAEAMASNIGSTATIVGNPQNMFIGVKSGISFARFFLYLSPIALLSSFVLIAVIYWFYRREFGGNFAASVSIAPQPHSYDIPALKRLVPILAGMMVLFFLSSTLHLEIPLIALGGAALVLMVEKVKPSKVFRRVDWELLLFFVGLFVVIEGAYRAGVLNLLLDRVTIAPDIKGVVSLSIFSAVVSQVVSNVPLTLLVTPLIQNVPGDILWIALAAGATLGGNITIIGAVANIIVVEGANREGVNLRFLEFMKIGLVVTAITIALAILVLAGEYRLGLLR